MRVIIIGGGGHAQVCADIFLRMREYDQSLNLLGYVDDDPALSGRCFLGVPVLGKIASLSTIAHEAVIIAIGDNVTRKSMFDEAINRGEHLIIARHPATTIAHDVKIGPGSMICAGVVINTGSTIGANVILNTSSSIDHHNTIRDHVHIAPGVHLGGEVTIDEGVLVGIRAVVMQNRYNVPVVLTRKALAEGRLGRILMAQCNVVWNRCHEYYSQSPWLGRKAFEGGALYTQVSHFIDLILWLCGDVIDASAHIETKNHDVEIEDCGVALLRLCGGTMCSLFWTTCAYDRNFEGSILLIGERGTVKIGGQYLNRMEHWEVEGYPLPEGINWVDRPNSYGKYKGSSSNHDKVLADVIRSVNHKSVELVTGEEGRKTIRAIELIYERCDAEDRGGRKG